MKNRFWLSLTAIALASSMLLCTVGCDGKDSATQPPTEQENTEEEAPPTPEAPPILTEGYTGTVGEITFTLPALGESVTVHTELQLSYLKEKLVNNFSKYVDGQQELSKPAPVTFTWEADGAASDAAYTLAVSESDTMSDPWEFTTSELTLDVYNLKIGTTYYWTVSVGDDTSGTAFFTTESRGPRNVFVDGVANVRDLGGWSLGDKKTVKQGLIYRCGRLNVDYSQNKSVTDEGVDMMLNTFKIKTEIDLRGGKNDPSEAGNLTKSVLGDAVAYHHIGMDWSEKNMLTGNKDEIKQVFSIFADEESYPIIFHCSIGTDRTGIISFLLNGLLGVQEGDLYRDYLFSNFAYIQGTRSVDVISGPKGYGTYIKSNYEGDTLSEKIKNALLSIGVTQAQIDSIIKILGA